MSAPPLSGTMNPNPLDTSNHLMTPESSMTLAASSARSPPVSRVGPRPEPCPLNSSDVMASHASICFGASSRALLLRIKLPRSKIAPGLSAERPKWICTPRKALKDVHILAVDDMHEALYVCLIGRSTARAPRRYRRG